VHATGAMKRCSRPRIAREKDSVLIVSPPSLKAIVSVVACPVVELYEHDWKSWSSLARIASNLCVKQRPGADEKQPL
jgi:hypothetical protein